MAIVIIVILVQKQIIVNPVFFATLSIFPSPWKLVMTGENEDEKCHIFQLDWRLSERQAARLSGNDTVRART